MKRWLLAAALVLPALPGARGEEPANAPKSADCLMLNNQVLGPRAGDRPLPLLAGNPEHGFRLACSVPWNTLSPKNQPLAVLGCFRGNLLQLENDVACGRGTGMLWVNSRWVVTSAELRRPQNQWAMCQQLETGAWAGTRAFKVDCIPREKSGAPPASAPPPKPAPSPQPQSHPDRPN